MNIKLNKYEKKKVKDLYRRLKNAELLSDEISKYYYNYAENINRELQKLVKNVKIDSVITEKEADQILDQLDELTIKKLRKLLRQLNINHDILNSKKYKKIEDDGWFIFDYIFVNLYTLQSQKIHDFLFSMLKIGYVNSVKDILNITKNIDDKEIEKILSNSWSGLNFNKRLEINNEKIKEEIKKNVYKSLLTGEVSEKIKERNVELLGQGANQTKRLLRTETAAYSNEIEAKAANDCGINSYMFISIGDDHTCGNCLDLHGTTHTYNRRQVGYNYPPLHPNCRCIAIPYWR